ncbi:hypothetical protein IID24_00475 [Patescibacteria group bacterium]|nr:hypothetical protein [Patescibacteria group bacterium]
MSIANLMAVIWVVMLGMPVLATSWTAKSLDMPVFISISALVLGIICIILGGIFAILGWRRTKEENIPALDESTSTIIFSYIGFPFLALGLLSELLDMHVLSISLFGAGIICIIIAGKYAILWWRSTKERNALAFKVYDLRRSQYRFIADDRQVLLPISLFVAGIICIILGGIFAILWWRSIKKKRFGTQST